MGLRNARHDTRKKFNLLWLVLRSFIKLTGFIVIQKNDVGDFLH